MRKRWKKRGTNGERGEIQKCKKSAYKKTETEKKRDRGHDGFGLLVLPSGQLADLFI